MSLNHNRIKVVDLETDSPNKILTTNSNGEIEFSDINNIKIDSYNGLDYITEGKSLDARQGKVLKDLIDDINVLVTSDNTNLDTIQKLANSVEVIQTSLNTILINDLTSGGTTKALTAEMGKVLQNTKAGKLIAVSSQTGTSYTLQESDLLKRIVFSNINPVSLILPANTAVPLAIGSKIEITQQGNGIVTIGGGVSFVTNLSLSMVKGETRILTKIDNDTWTIEGNKVDLISPIYNTFYIENTIGNDNTGVMGLSSKPFKTLQGAINWFQANTPVSSSTFSSNYTFEILDGKAYTITKPVMQEYTGNVNSAQCPVVNIISKHSCQITFSNPTTSTTMIVMSSLTGLRQDYSRLNIDMPLGTIVIGGTNDIQLTQIFENTLRPSYQIININVAVFTVSVASKIMSLDSIGYFNANKQGTGISTFNAKQVNLNASCTFMASINPGLEVNINTINFNASGSVFCDEMAGVLSFKQINSAYPFLLAGRINNGTINHGNIACSYTTPFKYLAGHTSNDETILAFINYTNSKTFITGGGYIDDFNQSNCRYILSGNEVEYTNATKLFGALNGVISDNHIRAHIKINDLNIPNGSILIYGARNNKGIALYNCNLNIAGIVTSGFNSTLDAGNFTSQQVTWLEIYGKCQITTSLPVGTEVVSSLYYPTNGQGCKVNIFGDLVIVNGKITTNSSMLISKNNNRSNY